MGGQIHLKMVLVMFEVTSKVSNVIVVISMKIKKYDDGALIDVLSLACL